MVRRVRTGKPPTSAVFPAGAAAGNPHQLLGSSPDALKTRGKARYLLPPSSPFAYPLPEHARTWRSAVFIVKVQLARARSVPPPGQPATRPAASARARAVSRDVWTARLAPRAGWRRRGRVMQGPLIDQQTHENGSIYYPLNCQCHVCARCAEEARSSKVTCVRASLTTHAVGSHHATRQYGRLSPGGSGCVL